MLGSLLGAYRVESELGTGGMGSVYLASVEGEVPGLALGERVAIKVVHPHLLAREGTFRRFVREGEIGRQVDHENVVRTYAADALAVGDAHYHFLVMEYVEGRTLRQLLEDLGTVPEALLREIARQVSAGLCEIHEAGIVHRDLKPENILITEGHQIRIMDLGLARLVDESLALTRAGQFAGSLLYSAPEQFGKGELGPAVDLYALGVLLYELATGENPFARDLAVESVQAQLSFVPPRLQERDPDASAFLSELIHTLLAKDPGSRFESACVLGRLLEEGEASRWWVEREQRIREQRAHVPRVVLRRETRVHGREEELAILREAWGHARDGRGGVVFLEGEAGIGKTRLVDSFLTDFDGGGVHALYGSYLVSGGLGGLSDAVLDRFCKASLEESLRPYLTETPRLAPAFAAMVRHEAPPEGSDPIQGDAHQAVFVHLMRGLAEEKPLLWIVDDLQYAEPESRQIVLSMARAVEGHRVLLVVSAEPGLPEDELSHLSRLPHYRRVTLSRLGARDVIELLRDAFKSEELAERLGGKIAYKSDGVPFFVLEMIRGLREGKFIARSPDGTYVETRLVEEIEVPSAVRDLVGARLVGLPDEDRDLLDVASVAGHLFDPDLVARVLERKRVRVLQSLASIERRSGVVRASGDVYRFDHHQIQDVVYGDLAAGLRKEYHFLLAETFAEREGAAEKGPDGLPGNSCLFLARHHLRGSRPEESLPFLLPALGHLAVAGRNDAAARLADRALGIEGLLVGAARADVLLENADLLNVLGRREEQEAAAEEAESLAEDLGDALLVSRAGRALGILHYRAARHAEAEAAYRRSLDSARSIGDRRREAGALGNLGNVFWSLGRYEEARDSYERSLALSRETGDRGGEATAMGSLGMVCWTLGRHEEAVAHGERNLALAREVGNLHGEVIALANLGVFHQSLGRLEKVREIDESYLALSRSIGYRLGEAHAMGSLGLVHQSLGRFEDARESHARHLALSREIGDAQGEATACGNLGRAHESLGLLTEALEHHRRHLEMAKEIGDPRIESTARGRLGVTFHTLGDLDEGAAQLERQHELSREIRYRIGEGEALLALGRLLVDLGDRDAAMRRIEQALAVWRELRDPERIIRALALRSGLLHAGGRTPEAVQGIDEALALAEERGFPGPVVTLACRRVHLTGEGAQAASDRLTRDADRVAFGPRMEACFLLWKGTGDPEHLREAHRQLRELEGHAPEEYRELMIANVPLHRDIAAAWGGESSKWGAR